MPIRCKRTENGGALSDCKKKSGHTLGNHGRGGVRLERPRGGRPATPNKAKGEMKQTVAWPRITRKSQRGRRRVMG